jgi:iron(III) transport system substrate-binding protein
LALIFGAAAPSAKTTKKPTKKPPAAKAPSAATIAKNLANLYAQAKTEGSVTLEVETTPTSYAALISGFEQKYPGISVSMIDIPGPQLASQVVSQAATGNLSIDAGLGRPENLGPIIQRKLLAKPNWLGLGDLSTQILLGGLLVKDSDFVTGVVYNTNQVTPAEAPHSWADLLNSNFSNGRLAIDGEPTEGFESELVSGAWPLKQYTTFLARLDAQKPLVIYSAAPLLNAVAQGQAAIGLAPLTIVSALIKRGAPLAVAPVQPLITSPDGVFVMKGAAHPAAAELLASYLGSPAAVPLWQQSGWTNASPASLGGEAGILGAAPVTKFVRLNTAAQVALFHKAQNLDIQYFGLTG